MLYTEQNVRDNIRNRDGKRVFFLSKGDQLTSAARDFLNRERIEIRSGADAKITEYRLLCGGSLTEKPEQMTHLQGDVLVPKTHPRIAFRGCIDTLESTLLLCQLIAGDALRKSLDEVLKLTRFLIRCDVLNEPLPAQPLCGLTEAEMRKRSHFPQDYYGIPHFMPEYTDGEMILRLNFARCTARAAELAAVAAFSDQDGIPTRPDILQATNRISSMLYILMIQEKAEHRGTDNG